MSLLSFFWQENKKTSAVVAKERLQIILAHQRCSASNANVDFLPALQKDLLDVIARYIHIDPKDLAVNMERKNDLDVIEVRIGLPQNNDLI